MTRTRWSTISGSRRTADCCSAGAAITPVASRAASSAPWRRACAGSTRSWPHKRVDYAWGGKVGIVVNRVPLLGRIGANVFYALGYSGHGVSLTHACGEIMADAVAGTFERMDVFAKVPHRRIPFGQTFGSQTGGAGHALFSPARYACSRQTCTAHRSMVRPPHQSGLHARCYEACCALKMPFRLVVRILLCYQLLQSAMETRHKIKPGAYESVLSPK